MQAFSKTDQYSFMVNHQISAMDFWKRPLLDPLMKAFPLAMQALRITNRKTAFPVQVRFFLLIHFPHVDLNIGKNIFHQDYVSLILNISKL